MPIEKLFSKIKRSADCTKTDTESVLQVEIQVHATNIFSQGGS